MPATCRRTRSPLHAHTRLPQDIWRRCNAPEPCAPRESPDPTECTHPRWQTSRPHRRGTRRRMLNRELVQSEIPERETEMLVADAFPHAVVVPHFPTEIPLRALGAVAAPRLLPPGAAIDSDVHATASRARSFAAPSPCPRRASRLATCSLALGLSLAARSSAAALRRVRASRPLRVCVIAHTGD